MQESFSFNPWMSKLMPYYMNKLNRTSTQPLYDVIHAYEQWTNLFSDQFNAINKEAIKNIRSFASL